LYTAADPRPDDHGSRRVRSAGLLTGIILQRWSYGAQATGPSRRRRSSFGRAPRSAAMARG
jgi:hypothetical protein